MNKIIDWVLCGFNFMMAGINIAFYMDVDNEFRYLNLFAFVFSSCIAVWVMKD